MTLRGAGASPPDSSAEGRRLQVPTIPTTPLPTVIVGAVAYPTAAPGAPAIPSTPLPPSVIGSNDAENAATVQQSAAAIPPTTRPVPQSQVIALPTTAAPANNPGVGWPGATASASNAAWSSGRQPANLELWPRLANDQLMPCWETVVLADVKTGWPGKCLGLVMNDVATMTACAETCAQNPVCSVWQFTDNKCWHSEESASPSRNCEDREGDSLVVDGAQRLQHGSIRVIMDISSVQIKNLYNLGVFHGDDSEDGSARCRRWCYSYVYCQYWQYGENGCWVEAPPGSAAEYPLTTATGASRDTVFARTLRVGEYIQHFCPSAEEAKAVGASQPVASAYDCGAPFPIDKVWCGEQKGWYLLAALLLAVVGLLLCWQLCRRTARSKQTRALQLDETSDGEMLLPPVMAMTPVQQYVEVASPAPQLEYYTPVPTVASPLGSYAVVDQGQFFAGQGLVQPQLFPTARLY